MKSKSMMIVMSIIFITIVSLGCSNKAKPGTVDVKRQSVEGVTVGEVHTTLVDEGYETAGAVKAKNVSIIASKSMGSIKSILVKEGDVVTAGQLLLTIDNRDVSAQVAGAEAAYQEAVIARQEAKENQALVSITYERYKKLYQDGAIAKQEMDQVETKMQVANLEIGRLQQTIKRTTAAIAEAQAAYDFTNLTAPTAGIVTAKKTDIGSMATPGTALLVVEDNSSYTVEADIDEGLVGKVLIGMPVQTNIDAIGKELQAVITEIAPAVDPASRKFHIKMDVQGEGLKTGQYVRLKIVTNKKETIVVAKTAIVEKGQLTGVYTVDEDGVISYRIVRLGRVYGNQVEILSGLSVHDKIILNGIEKAVDGGKIKEVKLQ